VVADDDRHDGRLPVDDLESHLLESLSHPVGIADEPLDALRLLFENIKGRKSSCDGSGGRARAKNEGGGMVLQIIDHAFGADDKPAERAERFTERAHGKI